VIVPDRIGAIPFARNGQGGMMLPPVQHRSLSPNLVVQLADDLPAGRSSWQPTSSAGSSPSRCRT
jgi:hypothetical protein